jgi:hypothetical protein
MAGRGTMFVLVLIKLVTFFAATIVLIVLRAETNKAAE